MNTKTLLQQALDALSLPCAPCTGTDSEQIRDAIAALREALAAPMPEPVTWPALVAETVLDTPEPDKWIDCGEARPLPMFHMHTLILYGEKCAESGITHGVKTAPPAVPAPGDMVMVQTAASDWRLAAAKFLRDEADDQQRTNEQYPHHAAAYPSWVQRVDWMHRLAEKLEQLSAASPYGLDATRAMIAAAPAPVVPLTDEQFADIVAEASLAVDLAATPIKLLAFARAVLSAAPVVREPQDERAAFEAWIRKESGDLTTFGSGLNMHYQNSAVNNAWTGWQARAHGIGTTGGGNG